MENKDDRTEYNKQYARNHPEVNKASCKKWYEANREKKIKATKANLDKKRKELQPFRAANSAKWRAKYPEKARAISAEKSANRKRCTPPWADRKLMQKMILANLRAGFTTDHDVPLQGKNVCGLHVPWNLQAMTGQENYTKSCTYPWDHEAYWVKLADDMEFARKERIAIYKHFKDKFVVYADEYKV